MAWRETWAMDEGTRFVLASERGTPGVGPAATILGLELMGSMAPAFAASARSSAQIAPPSPSQVP